MTAIRLENRNGMGWVIEQYLLRPMNIQNSWFFWCWLTQVDLRVGLCKSTEVDLGLSSRVKSICNGAAVGIGWRSRFNHKSLQVDLKLIVW